jgi:hypothetical protein
MTTDIEGQCYGPRQVKLLGDAFDRAWAMIAPLVGSNLLLTEAIRLALANAVLNQMRRIGHDVESLCNAALKDAQFRYLLHQRLPGPGTNRVRAAS